MPSKSNNLCVLIGFILITLAFPGAATTDWYSTCTIIVHPGQSISCGDYQITNIQFSSPVKGHINTDGKLVVDELVYRTVMLPVNKLGKPFESVLLTEDSLDYIDTTETLRITASAFTDADSTLWEYENYNPQVKLTIQFRTQPAIEITVTPEVTTYEYRPDSHIGVTIDVKNSGTIDINNIQLKFDFGGLIPQQNNWSTIDHLVKGETRMYIYALSIPEVNQDRNFKIIANASFNMEIGKLNLPFIFIGSSDFTVTGAKPNILFLKYTKSRIYIDEENIPVIITVSNSGIYSLKNVVVEDSITEDLISKSNSYLWTIPELKPSSQEVFQYTFSPSKPGKFTLAPAKLRYSIGSEKSILSDKIDITVIDNGKKPKKLIIHPAAEYHLPKPTPTPTEAIQRTQTFRPALEQNHSRTVNVSPSPENTPQAQEQKKSSGYTGLEALIVLVTAALLLIKSRN